MKKSKLKYLFWLIIPLIFLTSCINSGNPNSGVDLVALTKNPIVMAIIGLVVLVVAFKWGGSKKG